MEGVRVRDGLLVDGGGWSGVVDVHVDDGRRRKRPRPTHTHAHTETGMSMSVSGSRWWDGIGGRGRSRWSVAKDQGFRDHKTKSADL